LKSATLFDATWKLLPFSSPKSVFWKDLHIRKHWSLNRSWRLFKPLLKQFSDPFLMMSALSKRVYGVRTVTGNSSACVSCFSVCLLWIKFLQSLHEKETHLITAAIMRHLL
jgi:hypothetical protein